ncbi:MAG: hypothetical protein NTU47_01040 [Ignavibacteriales bacterium]|nr:hypothetical protein [Ignavibacteriales bacterium]
MRSFLAILVGYLVFAVSAVAMFQLSGVDPHQQPGVGFMIGSTIYGVVFAISGGYVSAAIAARKQLMHAGIVAAIIAVAALISIFAQPGFPTHWSQITAIVFMAPSAVLGGWLRERQVKAGKTPS